MAALLNLLSGKSTPIQVQSTIGIQANNPVVRIIQVQYVSNMVLTLTQQIYWPNTPSLGWTSPVNVTYTANQYPDGDEYELYTKEIPPFYSIPPGGICK